MKNKLTILTFLLISSGLKAQNFYTCVPEDDWFKKQFDKNMLQEKFKTAQTQIHNDNAWEPVTENRTSGTLSQGIYRVILKGGDGGDSGRSQNGGNGGDGGRGNLCLSSNEHCDLNNSPNEQEAKDGKVGSSATYAGYNSGSSGEIKKEVFLVNDSSSYTACFGKKGEDGKDGKGGRGGNGGAGGRIKNCWKIGGGGGGGGAGGAATGGQGGGGAGGYFSVSGIISINVIGGKGAGSPYAKGGKVGKVGDNYKYTTEKGTTTNGKNGNTAKDVSGSGDYSNYGSGCQIGSDGYSGNIGKAGRGGRGSDGYYYCHGAQVSDFITFHRNHKLTVDDGERAFFGEDGRYGVAGSGGIGGRLMSSGETSYSGDGYVKIYKYKG